MQQSARIFLTLLFHRVGTDEAPDRYTLPLGMWREMVSYMTEHTNIVTISDTLAVADSGSGRPRVALTFDDGFLSDYEVVLPALLDNGIRASFFIPTGFLGRRGRLTVSQVRDIARAGMSVGSHSHTHPYLSLVGVSKVQDELLRSKIILEDMLGQPVDSLAVPGGDYNRTVLNVAAQAGYSLICTSDWGYNRVPPSSSATCHLVRRVPLYCGTTLQTLARLIQRDWLTVLFHASLHRVKRQVKMLVGMKSYLQLRALLDSQCDRESTP